MTIRPVALDNQGRSLSQICLKTTVQSGHSGRNRLLRLCFINYTLFRVDGIEISLIIKVEFLFYIG
jgi:hypothetical protein